MIGTRLLRCGRMGAVDPKRLAAWVARSCEAQGVPVKVTDESVVRAVTVLLGATRTAPAR